MVPPTFNPKEKGMAQYLIDHERDRYNLLGAEAFAPSGEVRSERLKIRGYIDRIDWINKDDGMRLIEYKGRAQISGATGTCILFNPLQRCDWTTR